MEIHPTSLIDASACIGTSVHIGPWCIIGAGVRLEEGVRLANNVVIEGETRIGSYTQIGSFSVIGTAPQHLRYGGEGTRVEIGSHTIIREHITIHRGTEIDQRVTRIGKHCYIMASSHIGHDCQIGDRVVLANDCHVGGHVVIGDHSMLGGSCAIHQHVRIGMSAMIGGVVPVLRDILPYCTVGHRDGGLLGINRIGLIRRKYTSADILRIRQAYQFLFHADGTFRERCKRFVASHESDPVLGVIARFLRAGTKRQYARPHRTSANGNSDEQI